MRLIATGSSVSPEQRSRSDDDWLARYESERDAAFRRELEPVAEAVETVSRITAAGIGVCVASQGKLSKTRVSLALTGLDLLFPQTARFSAYSVANGKPAPDVFLHAAASMGIAPARCIVVEDTPSGVTAAVSAQMRAVGYAADSDEQACATRAQPRSCTRSTSCRGYSTWADTPPNDACQ